MERLVSAVTTIASINLMDMAKWWIVMPVSIWWASIFLIQLLNPWFLQPVFGVTAVVFDVPDDIWEEAKWLIAVIFASDVSTKGLDIMGTYLSGKNGTQGRE